MSDYVFSHSFLFNSQFIFRFYILLLLHFIPVTNTKKYESINKKKSE